MTISVVQQAVPATQAPGTSQTISLTGVSASTSNLLLCTVGSTSATATFTCTDSQLQSVLTALNYNASQGTIYIFYLESANSGSHTFTITASVSCAFTVTLTEVSGLATSASLDTKSTVATGFSTGPAANNVIPANTGEFAVAVMGCDAYNFNGTTVTWASPLTAGTANNCVRWGYSILSSTSSFSSQATLGAAEDWVIATALFLPGSTGPISPTLLGQACL